MAATSYSTLPASAHISPGSQGNSFHSTNYGTYVASIGSLTSHPYQYQTNSYGNNHTDNQQQPSYSNGGYPTQQQQQLSDHSNSQTTKNNDRSKATNNNNTGSHPSMKTKQPPPPHKKNMDNQHAESKKHQHTESKKHQQNSHNGTTQHHPSVPVDSQHHTSQPNLVRSERQISNRPPKQQQQQQHKSQPPPQSKLNRTDPQISKSRASSPAHHRTPSDGPNNRVSETTYKTSNPSVELKLNKSSTMRAAANKKKEETREKKRQEQFFPSTKATLIQLKSQETSPQTDAEQSDREKTKRNKKLSHSVPKTKKQSHSDGEQSGSVKTNRSKKQSHSHSKERKSRRDGRRTQENNSSGDDDDNHKRHRSKSQKRTTFSDSHLHKDLHLPPLRHSRITPYHEPYMDYPFPPGHPLRRRFPYHNDYSPYRGQYDGRHLYEEANNIPPYLGPYHDPYDPFFDYQKRKIKPKHIQDRANHEDNHGGTNGRETEHDDRARSQLSRKSKHNNDHGGGRKSRHDYDENMRSHWPPGYLPEQYYDKNHMLEIWRQERNDHFKKKFKPTIHDVLYSQQWMKSDSYLENQRRRTVRDVQGYYFPYKKYTLKDYKDIQKLNHQNPFADPNEITIDRKERAKKRQEYGSLVERQIADHPGTRQIPPREMPPRKPWHLSSGEAHDPNIATKRERALEYAREQVKYRPVDFNNNDSYREDPTEQYVNNLFPKMNDDGDRSNNERTSRTYQSYDDYD